MKNNKVMAEVKYFWKELAVRERLICLAALIIMNLMHGVIGTVINVVLYVGCSYVLAMVGILQLVDWRSVRTQRTVSLIVIFMVIANILSTLGVFGFIFQLIWVVALVLLILKLVLGVDMGNLWNSIKRFFENL